MKKVFDALRKRVLWRPLLVLALVMILVFQNVFGVVVAVQAADSSWTQTDWSGGSGQTAWSDTTKFSSSSSVDNGTTGELSLTNTEELSNTDFESDLTGWDVPDFETELNSLVDSKGGVTWPLQETSGSYPQAYNAALSEGRNIVLNPLLEGTYDDESEGGGGTVNVAPQYSNYDAETNGTDTLNKNTNATYIYEGTASQYVHVDATGEGITTSQGNLGSLGKSFKFSVWVYVISGTVRFYANDTGSISSTTTGQWQELTATATVNSPGAIIVTSINAGAEFYVGKISVTQQNIPASSSYPGSELLTDGDMEAADTSAWTAGSNATLTKETTSPYGGSRSLRVAYNGTANPQAFQSIITVGKRYKISGRVRGDGTAYPRLIFGGAAVSGTTSTDWQYIEAEGVATTQWAYCQTQVSGAGYAEFDDISVTEVNPLNAANIGATVNQTANAKLEKAYSFDGSNDYINIYSTDLNSFFNPDAGTLLVFAKTSAWNDAIYRSFFRFRGSDSNQFWFTKTSTLNQISLISIFGGTNKTLTTTSLNGTTDAFMVAVTWDKNADQLKFYINGSQSGTTQTGLGAWSANLLSTDTVFGAANSTPANDWSGNIAYPTLLRSALSASEIASLYQNMANVTRDTGTTYGSSSGAAKVVASSNTIYIQSVNVGDTNQYNLTAYAYTDGSAVTSSDVELYYNGSTISTTYSDMGSGWYKLSGTLTGAAASRDFGVQVKSGKTVYLDDFSLNSYASSGSLTSSIFDTESASGAAWGTLTYSVTTPTNTSINIKARSSDSDSMIGATDFSSCSAITSGSDLTDTDCVTDGERYIQYQVTLANTNTAVSPTFEDISMVYAVYDSEGPTLTLDSPGDNNYINSERPIFKWKAATDSLGSVSDYDLVIDNPSLGTDQPSGDFTISDIPISRTTNYETNKYVVIYDNFGDSDTDNDYISVYTKSSSEWSTNSNSGENDGKLREGKVRWTVKATDNVGNQTSSSRTLFVDRTSPSISLTQINNIVYQGNSYATTDNTPTFYGKITDPLSGADNNGQAQDDYGPKIASGPEKIEIKIEKKMGLVYNLHTIYSLIINKAIWECETSSEVSDNTKQTCNKYLPFEYTPENNLNNGIYKITFTGRDKAGNEASTNFSLTIGSFSQIVTREEEKQIKEEIKEVTKEEVNESPEKEVEVTKPIVETTPSNLQQKGQNVAQEGINVINKIEDLFIVMIRGIGNGTRGVIAYTGKAIAGAANLAGHGLQESAKFANGRMNAVIVSTGKGLTTLSFKLGESAQNVSDKVGYTIINFTYRFVSEPTTIANVQEEVLSPTSVKISWETNHPATGKVNYGFEEGNYDFEQQTTKRSAFHEFILTDLEPGTDYYYEVMSQNKNYVYDASRRFTTPETQD